MDFRYKLLLIEDDESVEHYTCRMLEINGYDVVSVNNGSDAKLMAKSHCPDVILLDLGLPDMDGMSVLKSVRGWSQVPVIVVSSRGDEEDKVTALENGADDYVVKPFSPKEVMARVNAIVKRNSAAAAPAAPAPETVKFGGLEINCTSRDVYIDGVKANLTPKEYDLLFYLVRNKNIALTRNKLLEEVWGYDFFGDDRTIDTHIKMLRNNLGPYRNYIVTLRGMGYKFEAN